MPLAAPPCICNWCRLFFPNQDQLLFPISPPPLLCPLILHFRLPVALRHRYCSGLLSILCASPTSSLLLITLAAHLQIAPGSGVLLGSLHSQAPPTPGCREGLGCWGALVRLPQPFAGVCPLHSHGEVPLPQRLSMGAGLMEPGCPSPGSWPCQPVCAAPGAAASPAFHLCVFTAQREPSCPNSPCAPNFIVLPIYPYISI